MNILILGGTRFIGLHIVEALLSAGHRVSVFARGTSPDPLPSSVERLRGDRNDGAAGLRTLEGRSWDACVDVSGYLPKQVRPSVELLNDRVGQYVFISSASAYQTPPSRLPVVESTPLRNPFWQYSRDKIACEDLLVRAYRDERARCIAILGRVLGDLDLAEDAVQDAFVKAAERWPVDPAG